MREDLPVAILGAGPTGLAAAARLLRYGQAVVVLEAREQAGAAIADWGHLRLFSPWRCNIDQACADELLRGGWAPPDPEYIPTGAEVVQQYLIPLARSPLLTPHVRYRARVRSVTRLGAARSLVEGRADLPFEISVGEGRDEQRLLARAVIDATGVMDGARPIGSNGLAVPGEREAAARISYAVATPGKRGWAEQRVLVIGGGHTAMQSVVALSRRASPAGAAVDWAVRQPDVGPLLPVSGTDRFPARLALHAKTREALASHQVHVLVNSRFRRVDVTSDAIIMTWLDGTQREYDHVFVATGYRPDHRIASELQLSLDPVNECPAAMSEVIRAARGACSAVPSHGEAELRHPEHDYYVLGMRSFGRAPSFFLLAGYEQVRSVTARLAGDEEAVPHRPFPNLGVTSLPHFLCDHPYYLESAFA